MIENVTYFRKNYAVIGASSGVGRCVSTRLASLGANVLLVGRSLQRLQSTLEEMTPGRHSLFPYDVGNLQNLPSLVEKFFAQGALSGLLYCAGVAQHDRLKRLDPDKILNVTRVNFLGFVEIVRQIALRKTRDQKCNIVAISSLASTTHSKYMVAYSSSKAALEASVRTLSSELFSKNINICVLRAGYIDTPMLDSLRVDYGSLDNFLKTTNYQKVVIPPPVIADLLIYLVGDNAKYFTGGTVLVSGGAPY